VVSRKNTARRGRRTIQARKSASTRPLYTKNVEQRAMRMFGSRERFGRWLKTPLAQYQGQTPEQLLASEWGSRQLEVLLERMIDTSRIG
jgi:uncharacterized protein (DUF2384 family)